MRFAAPDGGDAPRKVHRLRTVVRAVVVLLVVVLSALAVFFWVHSEDMAVGQFNRTSVALARLGARRIKETFVRVEKRLYHRVQEEERMNRPPAFSLVAVLGLLPIFSAACEKPEPMIAAVTPPAARAPVVVKQVTSNGQLRAVDEETGRQVADALQMLDKVPAEELDQADRAAAKDPGKILGRWRIVHTIYKTNGLASEPAPPLLPAIWNLTRDGRLEVQNGNALELRYVFTGDRLIVSGLGPKQVYEIARLTERDLEVIAKISAGSVRIENTTVLTRAEP